ncbi:hypothetical protein DOTSEDRAFT_165309 [Dothistroma septosporum NZE10]|uniref:Uncharacterized protein n=1 Tax=Dothistroma septosporum (strain NZE10 / CBS 128990) TaxID=675120 RepID=N1Q5F1_DOTSN|nr:hypothetical protein DOTSEDRAFT_165309 [Dothistroma septosporum NZE10]
MSPFGSVARYILPASLPFDVEPSSVNVVLEVVVLSPMIMMADVVRFKAMVDELNEEIVLDKVALPLELVPREDPDILALVLTPAEAVSAVRETLELNVFDSAGEEALLVAAVSAGGVAAGLLDDKPVPCRGRRTLKSSVPPTGVCCTLGLPSSSWWECDRAAANDVCVRRCSTEWENEAMASDEATVLLSELDVCPAV